MSVGNLNVALFPMEIKWEDKEHNLKFLEDALHNLHPDTDLLILPETFSTGFITGDKELVRGFAERNTMSTIDRIKLLAAKYNIAIAGSFIADTGGSIYNRAFFIEPSGEETFADKKHLFTMVGEHNVFSPGNSRLAVRYRGWNIAMVICYDIRFPVWCRNRDNEYDLLIAVANWPVVRVDAWNKLLIARAIENESYVCGVDCKGIDKAGFEYDGSSSVIDFKGKYIEVKQENSPFLYGSLSMEKLEKFRSKFPAWKDADNFSLL
ncbi:MAG: nitrilase family protein [Muribaculaceae bacterium]|nr:nitrilase family protein [Muribaculaceae bacterium]